MSPPLLERPPEVVNTCPCGESYTRDSWTKLVLVVKNYLGLELRNCSCGSPRAIEVNQAKETGT